MSAIADEIKALVAKLTLGRLRITATTIQLPVTQSTTESSGAYAT